MLHPAHLKELQTRSFLGSPTHSPTPVQIRLLLETPPPQIESHCAQLDQLLHDAHWPPEQVRSSLGEPEHPSSTEQFRVRVTTPSLPQGSLHSDHSVHGFQVGQSSVLHDFCTKDSPAHSPTPVHSRSLVEMPPLQEMEHSVQSVHALHRAQTVSLQTLDS